MQVYNSWRDKYLEEREKKRKLQAALKRASPEGRAMMLGIRKFKEVSDSSLMSLSMRCPCAGSLNLP